MNRGQLNGLQYILAICLLLVSPCLFAEWNDSRSWHSRDGARSVMLAVGQARGEANELVYCQPVSGCPVDYRLSQLIWSYNSVTMLTAGIASKSDNLTLNLYGKIAVDEGDAVMDDYDWIYLNSDWSHWSHHEDTAVTDGLVWDVNVEVALYENKWSSLSLLFGYKQETWRWESRGGTYVYSDTGSGGYRDQIGSFTPGQLVISYEQRYQAPYLGLDVKYRWASWSLQASVLYSNQVEVSATDYHYLRDLIFEDSFDKGEMTAFQFELSYRVSRSFDAFVRYERQNFEEVRGNTTYINSNTGIVTGYCVNCAGADNVYSIPSLGVRYRF